MNRRFILGVFLGILATAPFILPIMYLECDYYDLHVMECLEAHTEGYTYSICSGFWYNMTEEEYLDSPVAVGPTEDPYTEVFHGSCTGRYRWVTLYDFLKGNVINVPEWGLYAKPY